jgi:GST-like protein
MAGEEYSIADIAIWPWYGALVAGSVYNAGEFLQVESYAHVNRWAKEIAARPAAKRGRMVNRTFGKPEDQLRERHDAADFETKTQDKLEPAQ